MSHMWLKVEFLWFVLRAADFMAFKWKNYSIHYLILVFSHVLDGSPFFFHFKPSSYLIALSPHWVQDPQGKHPEASPFIIKSFIHLLCRLRSELSYHAWFPEDMHYSILLTCAMLEQILKCHLQDSTFKFMAIILCLFEGGIVLSCIVPRGCALY